MTLERYLDDLEIPMRVSTPVSAVSYRGRVDQDALARAYDLLCARHPVLRARILPDERGFVLRVSPDQSADFAVLDGDESMLRSEATRRFDETQGVARLTLIRGDTTGYVAMRTSHAVVDAQCLWALQAELWELYTAVSRGADIRVPAKAELPRPPSEILKQRWGGDDPTVSQESTGSGTDRGNGQEPGELADYARRVRLSQATTQRLMDVARRHKTSIHALMCGTVLAAQRSLNSSVEPLPMICASVVDIRKRATPPVGATETTNFLGFHAANVMVPVNGDPIALGRELKAQLDSSIARRDLVTGGHRRMEMGQMTAAPLDQRLTIAGVTNGGVVPSLSHPEDLTLDDYITLLPRREKLPIPFYSIFTYEGRMTILHGLPEGVPDEQEEQYSKRFIDQLESLA